ncbi:SH3 domain-containing protein [Pontivivens ytuae]|uniref:SH3 domain-containing protein n=1 Tax=Pontivivens ytuae TaxID=2789856 RepID=A0A7S9LVA6_9RHOB|nr:SH3 domain-containing protein [Pontivivens ytuae]QPH55981.1 SH3 domain-containing protein [Pontivivens ytuae]
MKLLLTVLILLLPTAVTAQDTLPALFRVVDVEPDDVLNIRAEPTIEADIIGRLAHDAVAIEVTVEDAEGWGRINHRDGIGWVSLRFMERQPAPANGPRCFGVEPFWELSHDDEQAVWKTPEERRRSGLMTVLPDPLPDALGETVIVELSDRRMTLMSTAMECSDGASDRLYGLTSRLLIEKDGTPPQLLAGCCTMAP